MVKKQRGDGWVLISSDEDKTPKEKVSIPPSQQKIKISIEKRKKGKTVTLIQNLVLSHNDLKKLAKTLKVVCGTGGSINEDEIELQGNCVDKVKIWLNKNHWAIS